MNERIKKLRKALGFTQQKFANALGVSRNTIATYEMGKSLPSDAAIALICREFHVREQWLRAGVGEMFIDITKEEEIAAFIGNALADETDTFKKRFIAMLARLNSDEWALLEKMAKEMLDNPVND